MGNAVETDINADEMQDQDALAAQQHQRTCPKCDNVLEITIGYPTWCEKCNWNLEPEEPELLQWLKARQKQDPFEKLYEKVRRVRRDKIAIPESFASGNYKMTLDTLAVYGLALLINSLLFLPVFALVWFRLHEPTWVTAVFNTLPFFAISYWLWPNFGPLPDEFLAPEKYPTLYGFVNKIAQSLGAPKVNHIVINSMFNAAYSVYGLRRTPVLMLGWPYLAVLTREEKVALLGHELAHAVNGDPSRGLFVGTATHILQNLYKIIWLVRNWGLGLAFGFGLFLLVSALFARPLFSADIWHSMVLIVLGGLLLSLIPLLGVFGLRYFLWRERYRAEFRADRLAAQVAGSEPVASSLQKTSWAHAIAMAMNLHYRQMIKTKQYQDLTVLLNQHIEEAPAKETERIKRLEAKKEQIIYDTHPTKTALLAALAANPITTPSVTFSEAEWAAFEKEFAELIIEVQKKWYVSNLRARSGVRV